MVAIILWAVTIIFFVMMFVSKKYRELSENLLLGVGGFLVLRIAVLLLQQGKQHANVTYPPSVLPYGEQFLFFFLGILFLVKITKMTPPHEWFGDYGFSLWLFIIGVGQILGALLFNYHWFQYITGVTSLLIGMLFITSEKKHSLCIFQVASVLSVLFAFLFYCYHSIVHSGSIDVAGLSDAAIGYSIFIIFIILFIASGISKYGILSKKHCNYISKLCMSLFIATFIYYHPEIKASDLPIIKDSLKSVIVFSNTGLLGYSLSVVVFANKIIA